MKKNELLHRQLDRITPAMRQEVAWSAAIIDRIEGICREKGITQRELANRMGCNETQVSRWTSGFPNFTLRSLAKLSQALGEELIQIRDFRI